MEYDGGPEMAGSPYLVDRVPPLVLTDAQYRTARKLQTNARRSERQRLWTEAAIFWRALYAIYASAHCPEAVATRQNALAAQANADMADYRRTEAQLAALKGSA